jgi:hypothetical protein
MRLYDYQHRPEHPDNWHYVETRDLEDGELHTLQSWLRRMSKGGWNVTVIYTPAMRMGVWLERTQDAAMLKLTWGGE